LCCVHILCYECVASTGQRRRLKAGAVPSVFMFKLQQTTSAISRTERATRRQLRWTADTNPEAPSSDTESADVDVVAAEVVMEVDNNTLENRQDASISESLSTEDQSVQCNLPQRGVLHVDSFAENDRIILYYTGF